MMLKGDAGDAAAWAGVQPSQGVLWDPPYPKARSGGTTVRLKEWFPVPEDAERGEDALEYEELPAAWLAWFDRALENAVENMQEGGYVVVFADEPTSDPIKRAMRAAPGLKYRNEWVWWKYPNGGMGMGYYGRRSHEYLLVATKGKPWRHVTDKSSVLAHQLVKRSGAYPTEKPVELYVDLMERCVPQGGVAMDPSFGSGAIFEAAERCGRSALGIDPHEGAHAYARARLAQRRLLA